MHDVGRELTQAGNDPPSSGQTHGEVGLARQAKRRHADDGLAGIGVRSGSGRDDQDLMPAGREFVDDPADRIGDTVDLWQERLGDDRDPHVTSVDAASEQWASDA